MAIRSTYSDLVVRELVRHLGGAVIVARACGVSASAVSNWGLNRSGIAGRHHLALWRLAVARGVPWQPPGSEGWRLVRDEAAAATSADDGGSVTITQRSHSDAESVPVREAA